MSQTSIVHALTGGMPSDLNPNTRRLAQVATEEITGAVGTALTLAHPVASVVLASKNGSVLGSADYSVQGRTVTLGVAAVAGDVFVLLYYFTL